jgi:hypothetical protein
VPIVAGLAHHRDDLLDRRRVSRIALPLITGHPTSVMPGQGRRRATPTRGINNNTARRGTAPSIEQRTVPPLYEHCAETREPSLSALASTWPCESRRSALQTPGRRRGLSRNCRGACGRRWTSSVPSLANQRPIAALWAVRRRSWSGGARV